MAFNDNDQDKVSGIMDELKRQVRAAILEINIYRSEHNRSRDINCFSLVVAFYLGYFDPRAREHDKRVRKLLEYAQQTH